MVQGTDALVKVEFCADPVPVQTWHLGGEEGGSRVLLASQTRHERFSVLREQPSASQDCYVSTLRIDAAEITDSQDYTLHLESPLGLEKHTVRVTIGDIIAKVSLHFCNFTVTKWTTWPVLVGPAEAAARPPS